MMRLGLGLAVAAATVLVASSTGASVTAPATAGLTASRFGKGAAEIRPAKIVIANPNGSGSRILTTGWFSFVSPDGSRVAVIDSNVNWYTNPRIELYASSGGAPIRVIDVDCIRLFWSPDSSKFACEELSATAKPARLLLIDVASAAIKVLATGFFDGQLSFSPDSTQLAFVQYPKQAQYFNSRGKLRLIDLATRAITTVRAAGAASPVWGPTAIAFSTVKPRGQRFTFDVAVVQPDGSRFRRLTRFQPTTELYGLFIRLPGRWTVGGSSAAALGGTNIRTGLLYAIDPIRGGSRLIAESVSPTALSRDGRYAIGQKRGTPRPPVSPARRSCVCLGPVAKRKFFYARP